MSLLKFERRAFLQLLGATGLASMLDSSLLRADTRQPHGAGGGGYTAARVINEYSEFLPGEETALLASPAVSEVNGAGVRLRGTLGAPGLAIGEAHDGWHLLTVMEMNGTPTAVFEKHVTYRGAIAFVTADRGCIALVPKGVGDLAKIRPRQIAAPADVQLRRPARYVPGPDTPGEYILKSTDDPSYENVAALGPEYIGWTLVANEQSGRCVLSFSNLTELREN